MKLVFLDFDGVLNGGRWLASDESRALPYPASHFDPVAVERVRWLCEATGARVVVSSSWRLGRTVADLQALLPALPVVCKTAVDRRGRGVEVRNWLLVGPRVESFVILDDLSNMAPFGDRLVRTDPTVGITRADADRAVGLLEKRWATDPLLVRWV